MAIEIQPNGSSTWIPLDAEVEGDQSSIEINGTTVYLPEEYVDDFSHQDIGSHYYLEDTGQAQHPQATTAAAHRTEEYGLDVPENNPNTLVSLPSDHSAYDSTEQPNEVENYPSVENGDVVEFYWSASTWDYSTSQARFVFAPEGYTQSDGIRVRLTGPGYWRIEDVDAGSWDYYGDPAEDNFDNWTATDLHRMVVSFADWPDISTYLYNIDGGSSTLISSLTATNGPGTTGDRGFGWWWNPETGFHQSGFRLIDEGDI